MDKYIYQNDFSIPTLLCDEIINMYENNSLMHYQGVTLGGVQKRIKDTTDFLVPKCQNENEEWFKVEKFLYKELYKNFNKYIKIINDNDNYKPENNSNVLYKILNVEHHIDNFMIQKYNKGEGKYTYHDDGMVDIEKKRYRTITYLWYLNDVEEGGETEFNGNFKIKPKKGKLIFFPAFWCFPHTGKMPISSDKYIITGWFYIKIQN